MMTDLDFDYPVGLAIPIAPEGIQRLGAEGWASEAVAAFTAATDIPVEQHARLRAVLEGVAAASSDDARHFLLVGVDALALAPLSVYVTEAEISVEEQAEFLSSPSVVLPPAPERVETQHLGVGFSSTLAHSEGGVDFGTRRWLFFGHGMTVGAVLGPVAPYALAAVNPIAEAIVDSARVGGFDPRSNEEHIAWLVSAAARTGDDWKA